MRGRLVRLRQAFGNVLPVDVTHAMLKEYVERREGDGAQPATIRCELAVFGRMYTLAIQAGVPNTRPLLPTIKVVNARKGFFEADEIARALEHLPENIAPAIEFAYITGWRIGEIRKLTWTNHLDLDAGVIRLEVGETKNDAARTFPFAVHPALRGLVVRQCERALKLGTPWLFPRSDGSQLGTFVKAWATACKKAGCTGKLVHDCRRTAVRNLVRSDVSEKVAMTLTGHKTRVVSEADLAEAVRKLAERRSGS